MLKPSSCQGCPFYDKGKFFTPDEMIPGSKVLFLGQNPGSDEEKGHKLIKRVYRYRQKFDDFEQVTPAPLLGATGKQFNEKFLPLSKLERGKDISIANALRCRPGKALGMRADALPNITTAMKLESSQADIVKALKHCRDTYLIPNIPASVKTIVTMGRYAMFSLTGIQNEETEYRRRQGVVESWRGYAVDVPSFKQFNTVDVSRYHDLTSEYRIFFTMHIAALFKENEYAEGAASGNSRFMHATLNDFYKIKQMLDGTWPRVMPSYSTIAPISWPKYACFDTEYVPTNLNLIRWSLCDTNDNLYCVEADDTPDNILIEPGSTALGQNWLADYNFFRNMVDVSTVRLEDLLYAHAVLWTGEPHSLNYIASLFGLLNRHKHLPDDEPGFYSAADAYVPMQIWKDRIIPDFKQDPSSWKIYRKLMIPLITFIHRSQEQGTRIKSSQLEHVQSILQERLEEYQDKARMITNDATFKLSGRKKVLEAIYE